MGSVRPGSIRYDDAALIERLRGQARRLREKGRPDLAALAETCADSLERQSLGLPVVHRVDWDRRE